MYGPLPANMNVQYSAPLTGDTVTVAPSTTQLIIEPAGTLAALTITLPANPLKGQPLNIASTQVVTALTMSGGTILGGLTTIAANGFAQYCFNSPKWYRVA